MLLTALTLYELCAPPHSNFTMFAKSVYAIVLKVLGKMQKTIIVAKEVIEQTGRPKKYFQTESSHQYLSSVHLFSKNSQLLSQIIRHFRLWWNSFDMGKNNI